jgi:thiamine biosynthesis lipoprotein
LYTYTPFSRLCYNFQKQGQKGAAMAEAERVLHLMGTVITLKVTHAQAEQLLDQAEAMLKDYTYRFSANSETSQLAAIKHQAGLRPVKVDQDLFDLIKLGKAQSLALGSFLNIAIGPLIKTWRIGFSEANQPSKADISKALQLINPLDIELDEDKQSVYLTKPGMEIDLGALAKGYFADMIIAHFQENGATDGFIDLGGNVLVLGEKTYRIGIQNPFLPRGNYVDAIDVQNQSVVTSGIYERKLTIGNQTFHHILDPKTGYPADSDVASITIISKKSVDGEIWTTRLFGCNAVQVIQNLNQHPHLAGIVITKDGQMAKTKNLLQA